MLALCEWLSFFTSHPYPNQVLWSHASPTCGKCLYRIIGWPGQSLSCKFVITVNPRFLHIYHLPLKVNVTSICVGWVLFWVRAVAHQIKRPGNGQIQAWGFWGIAGRDKINSDSVYSWWHDKINSDWIRFRIALVLGKARLDS